MSTAGFDTASVVGGLPDVYDAPSGRVEPEGTSTHAATARGPSQPRHLSRGHGEAKLGDGVHGDAVGVGARAEHADDLDGRNTGGNTLWNKLHLGSRHADGGGVDAHWAATGSGAASATALAGGTDQRARMATGAQKPKSVSISMKRLPPATSAGVAGHAGARAGRGAGRHQHGGSPAVVPILRSTDSAPSSGGPKALDAPTLRAGAGARGAAGAEAVTHALGRLTGMGPGSSKKGVKWGETEEARL